ncbi:nucleotidyltransferase domain-containing protein [Candidatus Desantisbacteria bacterium CG_4_8_14_3_um_filter_40_12]|uniref:Nucleotidyltransferase domain-containing protein n=4 Tax=unclassified Candidatus Desantisiibacteriota TaxID=3106372 RepID=A0A2M7J9M3_9BACT|nr:MAG: nucleotidyltransferase domain-containing protein [Candidatus Desantisbacteria bacterium CG_4_8_14_3_um_filter_40_12]PIY19704.1 MAG: nucleotidyltransferase domain-containing protein [Candidatus Desantisbacteria bacterium CG_4_10_14_3_um_filter_40_18]
MKYGWQKKVVMVNYEPYIQKAIEIRENKQRLLEIRYANAWETARKAAHILKNEYSADEVILFGSLLHKQFFSLTSDIDVAVSGIPCDKFFQALYAVGFLSDIRVEMVDIEECRDYIKEIIKKEGIKL